jgi:hypothetical protein
MDDEEPLQNALPDSNRHNRTELDHGRFADQVLGDGGVVHHPGQPAQLLDRPIELGVDAAVALRVLQGGAQLGKDLDTQDTDALAQQPSAFAGQRHLCGALQIQHRQAVTAPHGHRPAWTRRPSRYAHPGDGPALRAGR